MYPYEIGGLSATTLAERFGTPLFVYESAKIRSQYERMTGAFDVPNLQIHYACKALTNPSILRFVRSLGTGLDCVSIQEIRLGLEAGFSPEDILYTPNCVSVDEIERALALGVRLNIDNLQLLEDLGHRHPGLGVCIRINPHIMAGGNANISVGHIDSKFGISIHQMPMVARLVDALGIRVEGLHMHTGSDILDINAFLMAVDILFQAAKDFPDLEYLDFGSGFKVKYKEDDYETDIVKFGQLMSKKFNQFCEDQNRELALLFEPGKFLVSEAGTFLVQVNTVKQTTSTNFVGVDSGFNHMIRPMFYKAHHDIVNISNPEGIPRIYSVVGYICETDTFAWNRKLHEVRPGDVLAFKNAGAYCFSMASNYNSRYRPAEVLVHEGKAHLIRRRETFEDLLHNVVEPEIEWEA